MPIKIPANLPAHAVLSAEGVMVMDPSHADRQDIRPLRIALLNLMPLKIQTENQFARLIGATPLQIELTLLRMTSHQTKNTSSDHMEQFYRNLITKSESESMSCPVAVQKERSLLNHICVFSLFNIFLRIA